MSLEGLNAILDKEEVVFTFSAQDLLERAADVDAQYRQHIRTYVPMHSGMAGEDREDVEGFAKRLIRKIKERRAPRGYVTADFGYGKTSTGIYIWDKALEANIAAVPPFQMNSLLDLIVATYGWVNYILGQSKPSLQDAATEIYQAYTERTLADLSRYYGIDIRHIQQLHQDGKLNLELRSIDIVNFFQSMTDLVIEAGFDGLLVIPDEVQQYLEPQIKVGKSDPIGPLFNLIQDLAARQGELSFGLLLIIPQKELGVINDQRGDLIDRIRELTLDLKTIYDQGFPLRLWNKLAEAFDFEEHSHQIVRSETLESIGQIAVRPDLSNGPRTVVNIFRRITARYLELGAPARTPYTPIDLINDFLNEEIAFDGTKRIQEVVKRALNNEVIRKNTHLSQAVLLAAAFPSDGAKPDLQNQYGLRSAFVELLDSAFGTLITNIGDRANPGTVLLGLEQTEGNREWLDIVLSEFTRNYYENAAVTKTRAERAFVDLLTRKVFKPDDWAVRANTSSELLGRSLLLEGSFPRIAREFPKRLIQIRISTDEAQFEPPNTTTDAILDFRLHRYLFDEELKPVMVPAETYLDEHRGLITVNLSTGDGQLHRALETTLTKTIPLERLNALFLLNLYTYFEERLARGQVPKDFDPILKSQIQPAILESVLALVINQSVGSPFDAAGARLLEVMLSQLFITRYPDYKTLMVLKQGWQSPLLQYIGAIRQVPSLAQKQGDLEIEGTKDDIAGLLSMTNTAFDSFTNNYPFFIQITRPFRSKSKGQPASGASKFTMHKLEQQIVEWLEASLSHVVIDEQDVKCLSVDELHSWVSRLGYKEDELRVLIEIMEARELVISNPGYLCQKPYSPISVEEIVALLHSIRVQTEDLQRAFPEANEFRLAHDRIVELGHSLQGGQESVSHMDLERIELLAREIARSVDSSTASRISELNGQIGSLTRRIPSLEQGIQEGLLIPIQISTQFAHKLEDVRQQLLYQFDVLKDGLQKSRNLLQQLGQQIQTQNYSLESISSISRDVKNQASLVETFIKRVHTLTTNAGLYRDWMRSTAAWTELLERIRQLGSSGKSLEEVLLNIEQSILSELNQDDFTALSTVHTFEQQLAGISNEIRRIENEEQNRFRALQQDYLDLLATIGTSGWSAIIYSPLDPEAVYEQLHYQVQRAVIARLDELDDLLGQLQSTARQAMLSNSGKNLETIEGLLSKIDDLKIRLPYTKANDPDCIRDIAPTGKKCLNSLVREIADILVELGKIQAELSSQHEISPELTQDELALMKYLSMRQSTDIVEILSEFDQSDQVWDILRSLWRKQQIRITLEQVRSHQEMN